MRWCWTALLLVSVACSQQEPRPVRLELAPRTSCGVRPLEYDTSCVKALEVRVTDAQRNVLAVHCTPISMVTLEDLDVAQEVFTVLDDVRAHAQVYVELRGFQSVDKTPCSDLRADEVLLWGSSELVDLSDQDTTVVTVSHECRPDCGCDALGSVDCPFALTTGICGPAPNLTCSGRECPPSDCYGGALTCVSKSCRPYLGGMCHNCELGGNLACDSGLCVFNTTACDHFCALPCPGDSAATCPANMSCKRLGDGTFQPYGTPAPSCP